MKAIKTPETEGEALLLADEAITLAQRIARDMEGGWDGTDLLASRYNCDKLRSILAALWRWEK